MGGRPVIPPLSPGELTAFRNKDEWAVNADPAEHHRRGIYILSRRTFPFPMFERFDSPDSAVSCPGRVVTTVAPQALWSLNNQVVYEQAVQFANRLVAERGDKPSACVERAWLLALGRKPGAGELSQGLALIEALEKSEDGKDKGVPTDRPAALAKVEPAHAAALTGFCLALFNLNEFLSVD
jgi:hypothetical protein